MAGCPVTLFCYWGGNIVEGPNSLGYEGGQQKGIRVNRDTSYTQLLDKTYQLTNVDMEKVNIRMVCRYPDIIRPSGEEYIRMDVTDNEDVIIMLDVVNAHPQLNSIHVYLLLESKCNTAYSESQARRTVEPSSQPNMTSPEFQARMTVGPSSQPCMTSLQSQARSTVGLSFQPNVISLESQARTVEPSSEPNMASSGAQASWTVEPSSPPNRTSPGSQATSTAGPNFQPPGCPGIFQFSQNYTPFGFLLTNEMHEERGRNVLFDLNAGEPRGLNTESCVFATHGIEVNNNCVEGLDFDSSDNVHHEEINTTDQQPFDLSSPFFTNIVVVHEAADRQQISVSDTHTWDPSQELRKGLIFVDKAEFLNAMKKYHVQNRDFIVDHQCSQSILLKCKFHFQTGCKWRVRASKWKKHGKFQIGVYKGPHTCILHPWLEQDDRKMDSLSMAREIKDLVKAEPTIKVTTLRTHIFNRHGCTISHKRVWRAKQKALAEVLVESNTGCSTSCS